jgi:hypothetical protein
MHASDDQYPYQTLLLLLKLFKGQQNILVLHAPPFRDVLMIARKAVMNSSSTESKCAVRTVFSTEVGGKLTE